MVDNKPSTHDICMAIQAIEHFCKKYKVRLETPNVIHMAIALRERDKFEWTPCGEGFRRIQFIPPDRNGRVALVFGYDSFNAALTDELHEMLKRFTNNRLVG